MTPAVAVQQGTGDPPSTFYEALHRIAERMEPKVARAFVDALESLETDQTALISALRRQNPEAVARAVSANQLGEALNRQQMRSLIKRNVLSGAEVSAEELADFGISVGTGGADAIAFQSVNSKAVTAARQQAGRLITEVAEETKQAVREYVTDAFTDGVPPRRLSRQVRGVVGIHSRQAGYVSNMRRDLEALREATEDEAVDLVDRITGRRLDAATQQKVRSRGLRGQMTDEFIDEVVDTYATSMHNLRSQNIARTETIRASNRGQQALWEAGRDQGVIDADTTRRRWIVTPDDRLCPICATMAGQSRTLQEPFVSPFNGAEAMVPPIHPSCRCAVGLSFNR